MRILITGSRGQIGQCLRKVLPEDWELIATDSKTLNITQFENVENMVSVFQPDVLVNTAGYTDVVAAETDAERAFAINAQGTLNLARAAKKHGARMLHLSTDYVFDGKKTTPYTESDIPNPLNIYGQSKLIGELMALSFNPNTLIIRTSGVFGDHGNNFARSILQKARNNEKIQVVNDQICCPTYAFDLAITMVTIIKDYPELQGLQHFTGNEALSWYDFAHKILTLAKLDTSLLEAVNSDNAQVSRPAYSVLASENQLELYARSLESAIISTVEEMA
ncbi:MAG: dTDP-4-dehydrorhamnose reductase [Neisseriaceae bacterium]|nr:dTDP-4-dehydrorhamnose reductase [Neisseriaceae bacterium]